MQINLNSLLLAILIGLMWFSQCRKEPIQPAPIITIERDTMPPIIINLPPGKPTIINNPIPADIDSFAIAQAFFASVFYDDTIRTDSATVMIRETVSRNSIQSRSVGVKFNFPTSTTITEIHQEKKRNKVLIGGTVGYSDRIVFVPTVALQDKRDRLFTIGYDPLNRGFHAGVFYKVRFK